MVSVRVVSPSLALPPLPCSQQYETGESCANKVKQWRLGKTWEGSTKHMSPNVGCLCLRAPGVESSQQLELSNSCRDIWTKTTWSRRQVIPRKFLAEDSSPSLHSQSPRPAHKSVEQSWCSLILPQAGWECSTPTANPPSEWVGLLNTDFGCFRY